MRVEEISCRGGAARWFGEGRAMRHKFWSRTRRVNARRRPPSEIAGNRSALPSRVQRGLEQTSARKPAICKRTEHRSRFRCENRQLVHLREVVRRQREHTRAKQFDPCVDPRRRRLGRPRLQTVRLEPIFARAAAKSNRRDIAMAITSLMIPTK